MYMKIQNLNYPRQFWQRRTEWKDLHDLISRLDEKARTAPRQENEWPDNRIKENRDLGRPVWTRHFDFQ